MLGPHTRKKQLKKGNITEGGDTYDLTQEVEEGGSDICAQPQLWSEFVSHLDYMRICLKDPEEAGGEERVILACGIMVENAWGWGGSVCVSRNVKGLVIMEADQAVEDRTGNRAGLSALNQHSDPLPRA